MKKRVLKKWVENTLIRLNIALFIILACVNDFNLIGFFVLIGMLSILLMNTYVLDRYSRK